jgi:hypothetical protein
MYAELARPAVASTVVMIPTDLLGNSALVLSARFARRIHEVVKDDRRVATCALVWWNCGYFQSIRMISASV